MRKTTSSLGLGGYEYADTVGVVVVGKATKNKVATRQTGYDGPVVSI